jgi:hypothetical protein
MWLILDKSTYGKVINSFYANQGSNFGSLEAVVRSQLTALWRPPSMSDVETFISLCDGRRSHVVHTARVRLSAALHRRMAQADPIVLENGDSFLYWRTGISEV